MLKLLAIVGLIVVVGLVSVLVYAALKPDTFRLERSTRIEAPPAKIFPLINDFRNWRG